MQVNTPFNNKLALLKQSPVGMRAALVDVTDTLDFAWAAVQSVFESQATPEHALKICEMMLAERDRNLREDRRQYAGIEE